MRMFREFSSKPAPVADVRGYLGIHRVQGGWVCREWAPDAEKLYLAGEFNGWNREEHPMLPLGNGCWVVYLPGEDTLWEGCRVTTVMESALVKEPKSVHWCVETSREEII